MYYIVHSSIDENRHARGGKAGDQTGREVCTRSWYSKPWGMVLRYRDAAVAKKARDIAIKLANSNIVGYDQNERNSLYKELERNGWDVDKYIRSGVKTECDCSSFVYACYCCVIAELRGLTNAPTTVTSRNFYKSHGFDVMLSSEYTTSSSKLLPGDLLNKSGSHIVMFAGTNVRVDSNASSNISSNAIASSVSTTLRKGSRGAAVVTLQKNLNTVMHASLTADGIFGINTYEVLKYFQSRYGLEVDGIYGPASRAKMGEALNKRIPALASASPNLKKGSRGEQVRLLQQDLNYVMCTHLDADGIFGANTYNVLKSFQSRYGLAADGIYGNNSKAIMSKALV